MSLRMHNLVICGRRTTVRLEDEMWEGLKEVAEREGCSVNALASRIYSQKKSDDNFSSAIRVFLILYYRDAATEADHTEAGHPKIRSRAGRRGERPPRRRPPVVAAAKPDEEIGGVPGCGVPGCVEPRSPDEGSLSV